MSERPYTHTSQFSRKDLGLPFDSRADPQARTPTTGIISRTIRDVPYHEALSRAKLIAENEGLLLIRMKHDQISVPPSDPSPAVNWEAHPNENQFTMHINWSRIKFQSVFTFYYVADRARL